MKNCKFVSVGMLLLVTGALAGPTQDEAPRPAARDATPTEIELIRDALQMKLKDADSAKFRSVRIIDPAVGSPYGDVCGDLSSKNGYGAYVGFTRFFTRFEVKPDGKRVFQTPILDDARVKLATIICSHYVLT